MKTKMKALTLALCAVMLVATTVFATVAYLTSTTATVTNTFTVGNVAITLDEAKVDEYGVADNSVARVTANTYKLIPGHSYTKDPIIHVDANSEDCYVFVQVVNGIEGAESTADDYISIATQMENNHWVAVDGVANLYIYNDTTEDATSNKTKVSKNTDLPVFGSFTIDSALKDLSAYVTADHADKIITVKAYAIQADGFENMAPAAIWAEFDGTK